MQEPHFEVFPEFKAASYAKRYELLCDKLMRKCCFYRGEANLYSVATFLLSRAATGQRGEYTQPSSDLTFSALARSLVAHVAAHSP